LSNDSRTAVPAGQYIIHDQHAARKRRADEIPLSRDFASLRLNAKGTLRLRAPGPSPPRGKNDAL